MSTVSSGPRSCSVARIALEQGRLAEARGHVEVTIELSKTYPVQLSHWRSHALLGEMARRLGDQAAEQRAGAEARRQLGALAEQLAGRVQAQMSWAAAAPLGSTR